MGLRMMLAGYVVGRDTKKEPGVPGMPLLTAYLRHRGELEVVVEEEEKHDSYREICYNLKVDGEDVCTYRVRKEGNIWLELFLGRPGKVVRNVLVTLEDDLGLDINNFEGTHCQDVFRLFCNYESAGRFAAVVYFPQRQESVSDNDQTTDSD